MKTRRLGSSPIQVSVVGVGNMSWPHCGYGESSGPNPSLDRTAARLMVAVALEQGINLFDTAEAYGCGIAEDLLGVALDELGRRADAVIVTKVGPVFGQERSGSRMCVLTRDHILKRCEASLRRLRTDYVDLYLAHRPDPGTPVEETIDAFKTLQDRGLIRSYGVSNFDADLLARACGCGDIAATQVAYSLIERDIEASVRPVCLEQNVAIMAYSPLGKGILSGAYDARRLPAPGDYRHRERHFSPHNLARHFAVTQRGKAIADKLGTTFSRLAIAWCLAQPGIATVIAGAKDSAQIRECAAAGTLVLPSWALEELERLTVNFVRSDTASGK